MSNTFIQLNDLHKAADGVYRKSADAADFNYSDGAEAEQTLKRILTDAQDLSSDSAELESHIVDWPTEYHLSSSRANLLRCLDLRGVKRVLELGCGCGSITRYLGEQSHLQVDSIEGSQTRAALAALRCQGLDNVTITSANFNQLEFPDDYYDLVLFVGVTEYAGRFSERETDQQALQDLLQLAKKTNTHNGVTLVAIENRAGLKYMLGASEDHFGKPYVGIQNYPEAAGIRTYTKNEWQQQIAVAGFSEHVFMYPFPDYKIPTQLIHQKVVENGSENIENSLLTALDKIKSRDYLMPFDLGEQESMLWQGLCAAGSFGEHTNSFLILLADDASRLSELADFEIQTYPDKQFASRYTPLYATATVDEQQQLNAENNSLRNELNLILCSRSWRLFAKFRPFLNAIGLGRK